MITCGMNVKEEFVKKRMLMNTCHHPSWDTYESLPQEQWEELFGNSEDEKENDFEDKMFSRGG